jgi:D-aminopeptidase
MTAAIDETKRVRFRDLGLRFGRFEPGPHNAITDVRGVRVGHTTVDEDAPVSGRGPARTGVTAILPNRGNIFEERVVGSGFVLNGAGEVAGLTQVLEWGHIETPILLTNTLAVGLASDAVVNHMVKRFPGIGKTHDVIIPVVGECDDSWLNDIAGRHVREEHIVAAIETAKKGPVDEGNVGGGTGMVTCDLSGGIGTSSRRLPQQDGGYTLGVLVMSNFGHLRDLRMMGVPVGKLLVPRFPEEMLRKRTYGSIIAVLATDAPLLPHQLGRLSKRVALGIGRVGSFAAHGSGEIVVSFSTANSVPRHSKKMLAEVTFLLDPGLDQLYEAAIETTEEAILNAICAARPQTGVDGHHAPALPLDDVREILSRVDSLVYP